MKNLVKMLCLILTVIVIVTVMASCDDNPKHSDSNSNGSLDSNSDTTVACSHTYGSWSIKTEPDCAHAGIKARTCDKCGNVETEPIPELGHNYVGGICTVCGEKEK